MASPIGVRGRPFSRASAKWKESESVAARGNSDAQNLNLSSLLQQLDLLSVSRAFEV
jgi:hypothetical protein